MRHIVTSPSSARRLLKFFSCLMLFAVLIFPFSISTAETDSAKVAAEEDSVFSNPEDADSILKITSDESTVNVGGKMKLVAEITSPDEAALKSSVEWISQDENIATVDRKGNVKGVNPGTVQIMCRLKDNSDIKAYTWITVQQPVKSIKAEQNKIRLLFGASDAAAQGKVSAAVEPKDATVKSCAYSSSNEAVITVDNNGHLQAISPGSARIMITSLEKGSKVKAFCDVTVEQAISEISIPQSKTIGKKQTFSLKPRILPEKAARKKLEYTSSDTSIATVSQNGVVTAIECGEATITAKAADGSNVTAECKIKVIQMVKSIRLDKTNLTMDFNTTYDLKATVLPEDATKPNLQWSSSDQSVVSVSQGKLKAVGVGNVTIICSASDGSNAKAAVKVRVTYKTKSTNKLSDGSPLGGPYEMKYEVRNELRSGKVEVHSLTVQKLNNHYLRFAFSYNAPAGYGISAFSPPNGQFYMVLPKRSTASGEDYIQFEVHEDDFLASKFFTMKFYGRSDQFWVFPIIDSSLKKYLENPSSIPLQASSYSNSISILDNSTVQNLISSCPSIGKSTKPTKDFYNSINEYKRDFPAGKHSWRISIQNGVTYFADENKMTVLTYKPKGTLAEVSATLSWQIKILDALPSILSSAQQNGASLYAEKRASDGDYAQYADYHGIIDLLDSSKRDQVRDRMMTNRDDADEFYQVGIMLRELDTNGDGELSLEELGLTN